MGSPRSVAHAASAPTRRQARQSARPKLRRRSIFEVRAHARGGSHPAARIRRTAPDRTPICSRHEGEHRRGRLLGRVHAAAGIAEDAKLDGEAEPVARAPPRPDERQVVARRARNGGPSRRDRSGSRTAGFVARKTTGCEGACRAPVGGGSSFINCLPFNAILQQDIESKFARNCRARQIHSQTVVCERRQTSSSRRAAWLCARLQGRRTEQRPANESTQGCRLQASVRGGRFRWTMGPAGTASPARPSA